MSIYNSMFLAKPSWLWSRVQGYTDIGQIGLPLSSGLYAFNKKDYKGVSWLALAVFVNQVVLEVVKKVIFFIRPNKGNGSFPSGHTAAAFLGPTFLMVRYGFSYQSPALLSGYLVAP